MKSDVISRSELTASKSLPAAQPPAGWSAGQLLVAAAILSILSGAALSIDLSAARIAAEWNPPGDLRRLIALAEVFGWGGSVALIIATAAVLDPRSWRVMPRLAVCAFGAGLLADSCKLLLARQRPAAADLAGSVWQTFVEWLPLWRYGQPLGDYGHQLQSFPSGHAATAAGLAVVLAALYPRGRWWFALLAVLAGAQRICASAHFPSDVLAGAAIGCMVGASWTFSALGQQSRVATTE